MARWTDSNNWYNAYVDDASLVIQKVAGTATVLASVPFTAVENTSYNVHFRGEGLALTSNVWAAAATEPTGRMVSANDNSLTSGHVGVRILTQSAPATLTAFRADVP